ncbi:MAG: lysogenization protein HflD [Nevskiales bacterium]
MMIFPTRDATLAFAGVLQPLYWVHQIAAHGESNAERLQYSIDTILNLDPPSVDAVYGKAPQLGDGLGLLQQFLQGAQKPIKLDRMEQNLIMRYTGQVLRLGSRLQARRSVANQLAKGLRAIPRSAMDNNHDALLREQVEALAKLYTVHISPLSPRVMVNGQPTYLRNHQFVTDIRCQLLAALRSAVLWHQCGGRFWHLLFFRGFLLRQAQKLSSET